MSRFLEKYHINIWVFGYSPIKVYGCMVAFECMVILQSKFMVALQSRGKFLFFLDFNEARISEWTYWLYKPTILKWVLLSALQPELKKLFTIFKISEWIISKFTNRRIFVIPQQCPKEAASCWWLLLWGIKEATGQWCFLTCWGSPVHNRPSNH